MIVPHKANSSDKWDLIIVGGGIVGCSTALYAARSGLRVLIVERDTPGAAQSGRNLGFVRQQGRDFRELPLAMAALNLWDGLEQDLGRKVGWLRGGNAVLAINESDTANQSDWQSKAKQFGLDTVLLTQSQVREKLPLISDKARVRGAMFTASDGRAEPGRATRAMFEAAVESGISVILGGRATQLDLQAGHINGVWIDRKLYRAEQVLCAAGTESSKLLRAGGYNLPQEKIRATVARTVPAAGFTVNPCVSLPLTGIRQDVRGAFIFSVAGGEYDVRFDSWRYIRHYRDTRKSNPDAARVNYFGPLQKLVPSRPAATIADIAPTSEAVEPAYYRVQQAHDEIRTYLPAIADLEIEAVWAGIIDTLPDVVPVMGHVKSVDGLLVATGFSGHGFGLGPMAGKVMSELARGRPSSVEISGLSPARF
ncbi:pyridine nucleotide-disulfide oxidoreductase family protein (plasmid) [Ochrobactrum quorumnocens]|uniref:Pyridine nucleotide-disulfide oxidoreductase family protein n=1 Tax=Ochrobactrum quorumnocens TaxID=271865 RepID=A0A248UP53_9HYPH|nr:FAD-binding oxidoreductase [[Ochrobactrum] quorumnocens]ASV88633.1 pyridine nucleotide-disulfide oxidoreductase family protein [[Ochrobactrum] quorumnocens]